MCCSPTSAANGSGATSAIAPGVSDDIRTLLAFDPSFRLLVAHGRSDLVTPHGVTRYVLDNIPPIGGAGRVQLKLHRGGHMFYFDAAGAEGVYAGGGCAALTMVLGNIIAVIQPNIKRMLAYSSIAHAGYIAVAFAAGSEHGVSAALFYIFAYSLTNLGAFAIITIVGRNGDKLVNVTDFAGLGTKRPGLAALLSFFLLSLAGVPGTAGFTGKFFIFRSAVESNLIWLSVIGVVTTVVSFYYYLYVIVQMYMHEPNEDFADAHTPTALKLALAITAIGTLWLGIMPTRVLDWTTIASALR